MDNTWIKLYRKLLEHDVMKDPAAVHVFMWVLLSVDAKGNMTTGRIRASRELGLDPNAFRYILHEKLVKKYNLIEISLDASKRYTHISVTNWLKYQAHFADKSLDEQSYPQEVHTKENEISSNYLTQGNSLENEDGLTYQDDNLTLDLTQLPTQTFHTNDDLENTESVTQVLDENVTQKINTVLRNNNKENKNNIYISNVESEKPRRKKASKEAEGVNDEFIRQFLERFNKSKGSKYAAIVPLRDNFAHWLTIHEIETIFQAANNVGIHPYWRSRMTPEMLLRRKNPRGEDVDRISELANYVPEEQLARPVPSSRPIRNITEERLARERAGEPLFESVGGGIYGSTI